MRTFLSAVLFTSIVTACATDLEGIDGAADINGDEEKADGAQGIEVSGRLRPGTVDTTLTSRVPRPGYIFYAAEGTKVTLEVTRGGTSAGLDTVMKVYGPRLSDGSYPKTLATDDDAGYGKLSKVGSLELAIPGFYLVEVTTTAPVAMGDTKNARIKLSCSGTCDSELPVAPLGLDIKWFQRAAERKALALQAYGQATKRIEAKVAAGVPAQWGVVLDIDETTLDNSPYQKSRADLGLGYSPATWTEWVNQKAATPIPGALAFTKRVKQLGGKVVFVSNRLQATECAQTEANLAAHGFSYDGVFCKTSTSDKNPRFAAIANGTAAPSLPALAVQIYVGDNILDFPNVSQDIRKQPDSAFAAFGDTNFVLPNPMYGSWEKNAD
jgi:5'-nucleotidase (lipoprotein e(P4) family)